MSYFVECNCDSYDIYMIGSSIYPCDEVVGCPMFCYDVSTLEWEMVNNPLPGVKR